MNARDEILQRVRHALSDVIDDVEIPRDYRRAIDGDALEQFCEIVSDYQATVRRVGADSVGTTADSVLRERGIRKLAVPADLPDEWTPTAVEVVRDDGHLTSADLDAIDGALTGAALAIAQTGTIVLDAAEHQGRRMLTLVPDYHLCVVRADQVVSSVPEAVAALDPTRPITLISGPSATSDIELDRVEGVHGPRTLDVLLVTSS